MCSPIDLVVVNLYPFEATVAKPNVTLHDAIENIDIGGPSMLRSAAKNHDSVTVVVDPFDYERLAPELEQLVLEGRSNAAMRRSEHKRQQFGIILKVSEKSFGSGRLVPVTRK